MSALIGLFVYVEVYVKLRTKFMIGSFSAWFPFPVVSPPFVLSLSMIMMFGKKGPDYPRSFLGIFDNKYLWLLGHFYCPDYVVLPCSYMMLKGSLKNIDPSP